MPSNFWVARLGSSFGLTQGTYLRSGAKVPRCEWVFCPLQSLVLKPGRVALPASDPHVATTSSLTARTGFSLYYVSGRQPRGGEQGHDVTIITKLLLSFMVASGSLADRLTDQTQTTPQR